MENILDWFNARGRILQWLNGSSTQVHMGFLFLPRSLHIPALYFSFSLAQDCLVCQRNSTIKASATSKSFCIPKLVTHWTPKSNLCIMIVPGGVELVFPKLLAVPNLSLASPVKSQHLSINQICRICENLAWNRKCNI